MERFVDFITNPSWWSVILSAVSAIAVIVIAVVQIRLQKRQAESQEYDVYKSLYIMLSKANREIDAFFRNLYSALWEPQYNTDKNFLKSKQAHIDKLLKDLMDSYTDYELKFSKNTFNKDGYAQILLSMSLMLNRIDVALEQKKLKLASKGVQSLSYEKGMEDFAYATAVSKQFCGQELQVWAYSELESIIVLKRMVRCDDSLLESIRAKCKID